MPATATSARQSAYGLLEANRARLIASIEGLSANQMLTPLDGSWSIKDILTHVTSWDELVLPDLKRLQRGRTPALGSNPGEATDKWNDLLMAFRRNLPLDEVIEELTDVRAEIVAVLQSINDDRFVGQVVGHCQVAALHDWQHAQQINDWRIGKGA
jgi:uncharacterized damage-inducible protein DinB